MTVYFVWQDMKNDLPDDIVCSEATAKTLVEIYGAGSDYSEIYIDTLTWDDVITMIWKGKANG